MFITRTFGNTQVNPADCSLIQGRMGRPKLPLTPGAEGLVHSTPVCLAAALWLVRPLREQACTEGLRQLAAASPFGEVANVTNAATSSLANHRNVRVPITSKCLHPALCRVHPEVAPDPLPLQAWEWWRHAGLAWSALLSASAWCLCPRRSGARWVRVTGLLNLGRPPVSHALVVLAPRAPRPINMWACSRDADRMHEEADD